MHDINLVIGSLRGGGAERVAAQLCDGWSEQGYSVVLTTLSSGKDDDYKLSSSVQRVRLDLESHNGNIFMGLVSNLTRSLVLRRSLKKTPARNVIGFSGTSNVLVILASIGLSSQVVVSERNFPAKSIRGGMWSILRKHLYRFADAVVVQTIAGATWLEENTSARSSVVIPNAVRWPIPAGEPVVDINAAVDTKKKLLLSVGNLHVQKGHDLLLAALASSQFTKAGWQCVIVGAGDTDKFQALTKKYNLENQVLFVGRAGNIAEWYDRADAFAMSSRYEGFPNALLEAMASGCPVVSFDCPTGPAEMIQHEINGLLAEAENIEQLASHLDRIFLDEKLRLSLGTNAQLVSEKFSAAQMFKAWSNVLALETKA